jgi:hypothetical protein
MYNPLLETDKGFDAKALSDTWIAPKSSSETTTILSKDKHWRVIVQARDLSVPA